VDRLAICGFTTMDTTFAQDVELAVRFGLPAVGLCESKIPAGREQESLELLRSAGLRCASALPANLSPLPTIPAGLYPGPSDPAERTALIIGSIDRLAPFEPERIVLSTGAQGDLPLEQAEEIAADALRTIARHAAQIGVRLSLEPIRDVGFNGSWLRSGRDALRFLDLVGEPALDLCFDVYHLWDEPGVLDLVRANGSRIGSVQISDWHEPPRARGDRLIPGEGTIDLPALFAALEDGGYRGTYDVEIFSDDGRWGTAVPGSVWAMDPDEVYRRSIAGFQQAFDQAATNREVQQ
jgi:sugar phosphate isomerase/epimerase